MINAIGGSNTQASHPAPPPKGGGAGSAPSSASSSSSSTKVYDPRDTNKDGTVSFMEQMMYDLKHPESSNSKSTSSASTYNSTGTVSQQVTSSFVDKYV